MGKRRNQGMKVIPILKQDEIKALKEQGIKNRSDFLLFIRSNNLFELSRVSSIPVQKLKEVLQYCDLLRVNGVGVYSAAKLINNNIRTVKLLAKQNVYTLFRMMNKYPEDKEIRFYLVKRWILYARMLQTERY